MIQTLCDHIDQLDLALDQLALRDRNFDRFAIMLIDNVVELVLHQHAQDKNRNDETWRRLGKAKYDAKILSAALGQHFDAKVKFASESDLIGKELAVSLTRLHSFRNSAYHRGLRHEGILHSLAIFYLINCCELLKAYSPPFWSSGSGDKISHRAIKYIGNQDSLDVFLGASDRFSKAWDRLKAVAESMGTSLIKDLAQDMSRTIESSDHDIHFVVTNAPGKKHTRDQVVVESQVRTLAFSESGKSYAEANGYKGKAPNGLVDWLTENYPFPAKRDPIPSWQARQESVAAERGPHKALEKYCYFMLQTQELRSHLEEHAASLDGYIQEQIDLARGK
jgi:hypothetical protein